MPFLFRLHAIGNSQQGRGTVVRSSKMLDVQGVQLPYLLLGMLRPCSRQYRLCDTHAQMGHYDCFRAGLPPLATAPQSSRPLQYVKQ
jgi:hypothetical protein